jgi:radical SAM superfamily enzyme YgiQ (UPF0313 family)
LTRVLLINPPSPEALGAPLLGQQYVAAALLKRGCDVRVIDAAARYFTHDAGWIIDEAERFEPHLIGIALFSRWVWHAYELVDALRNRFPLLVAGGAHTTVRPDETLAHGFDIAVIGEAEGTICRLVDVIEGRDEIQNVSGIKYRAADGSIVAGPPAGFIDDLDGLASPQDAQHLFNPNWYDPTGTEIVPGGILTSRGCPARCTFCANYVTGRGFRYRSADHVVAELNFANAKSGTTFFPCWDDALTAHRKRTFELCETLERNIEFDLSWSAITRANQVTPDLLAAMQRAGLVCVNFGVESGDDEILRAIRKGVTTDQVVRALEEAKNLGLRTAANFMLGFPQETPRHLENTLRFMERIAPLVDTFSTLGVLVPFPGTPLYDDYHEEYGFSDWWLREDHSHYEALPPTDDLDRFYRAYIDDKNLDLDFFRYGQSTREMIRACLRFKGEHNLRMMGLLKDPVFQPSPVAIAG